ncbi:hypothetical protein HW537_10920 [Asaia siamensis]
MSETIQPPADTANDAATDDRFAGIEFGSETPETPGQEQIVPKGEVDRNVEEKPADKAPPKAPAAWELRRIGNLTGKWKSAEERGDRLEQELAEVRRALATARGEEEQRQPEMTPEQIRADERSRNEAQAAQERQVKEFEAVTVKVAQSLAGTHGWDAVKPMTDRLSETAGLDFNNPSHQQIIRDISELQDPGAVYYALANDPDAASALFDAPERRQYAMLQKFADGLTKAETSAKQAEAPAPRPAPQISRTPAPVAAATGSARTVSSRSIYDENLSMDDYVRLRSKK